MEPNMTNSDQSIRAARELFNLAIKNKDTGTIKNLLAPTYHIVTGRSAQNHGAMAESIRWAEVFRTDPTAIYRRTPREITINENWGIAEELGNWEGTYTAESLPVQASGIYSAKWQRAENGKWVLQVEVFTTLNCTGSESGCMKPDPIYE
jgi:ketosteroid isomerase-like protein